RGYATPTGDRGTAWRRICKGTRLLLEFPPWPRPSSMRVLILPASSHRIADDPPALRALNISLGVLVAILPLAHVTALRNILIGLVAAFALLQFRPTVWRNTPGLIPWLVWLVFAAASIGWSALPDASFQTFRRDQFYPFVVFL